MANEKEARLERATAPHQAGAGRARLAWLAWGICGLVVIATGLGLRDAILRPGNTPLGLISAIGLGLFPLAFAIPAALVVARLPGNAVGWLMMAPAISRLMDSFSRPIVTAVQAQPEPSPLLLFAVWCDNASWVLLVFPTLLLLLVFPTGRPPSRRWNWVVALAAGMLAAFFALGLFSVEMSPMNGTAAWQIRNPIGFIADDTFFLPIWFACLIILTVACVAALIRRVRRSAGVERLQIRWVLFAGALIGATYAPALLVEAWQPGNLIQEIALAAFSLAALTLPVAIAIAILRYRLYDIDVVIRRTVTYAIISAALASVYFGANLITQGMISALGGQRNEVAIVASTLSVAALFSPVRRRVQNGIDRRFNRQRYDADKVIADFAEYAAHETDLAALQARIVGVVAETIQPKQVTVWVKGGAPVDELSKVTAR